MNAVTLTITITDIGEGQCQAQLTNGWNTIACTAPQACEGDALRHIADVLRTAPVDVLYAAEHNVPLDREHPKFRRLLGWRD
jgi:hypothetical protein